MFESFFSPLPLLNLRNQFKVYRVLSSNFKSTNLIRSILPYTHMICIRKIEYSPYDYIFLKAFRAITPNKKKWI